MRAENPATLVFIEASEEALLRRFSETRRPHPLGHDRPVLEGLRRERVLMEPIRKLADVVIDTTKFNVHELRQFITHRFQKTDRRPMMVSVVSFGYKYGIPPDADLVFDVRFLPNPHFIPQAAKIFGARPARGALHSLVSANRGIPAARRGIADLFDPALYPGREELSDDRLWLHGRAASFGDAGGSGAQDAAEAEVFFQSRASRSGEVGRLRPAGLIFHAITKPDRLRPVLQIPSA